MTSVPEIPDTELRDRLDEVLLRAEAGERFTVTAKERPVAELGPPRPGTWVSGRALRRVWRSPAPQSLRAELDWLDD